MVQRCRVLETKDICLLFYTAVYSNNNGEKQNEFGWAELSGKEGARLGLAQFKSDLGYKAGTNAVVTITVEDIEKARQELLQKEVHLIDDIMEVEGHVKLQTFSDSDGNLFQLCQLL